MVPLIILMNYQNNEFRSHTLKLNNTLKGVPDCAMREFSKIEHNRLVNLNITLETLRSKNTCKAVNWLYDLLKQNIMIWPIAFLGIPWNID